MSGSRPNVQISVSRPISNLNVHANVRTAEFQQRKREPGPKANVPVNSTGAGIYLKVPEILKIKKKSEN